MPARPADPDTGNDLAVTVGQIEHAGMVERYEVLLEIARPVPFVGMRRIVPFCGSGDVPRIGEPRPHATGRILHGESTSVIEMEVGGEYELDCTGGAAR